MYEFLSNVLYHIDGFITFCYADRVYRFLMLLLLMMLAVLIVEISGLIYQIKYL